MPRWVDENQSIQIGFMTSSSDQVPLLFERCELITRDRVRPAAAAVLAELRASGIESIALLTQQTTVHGGIEFDDLSQRPERAEQLNIIRLRNIGRGR